MLQDFSVLNKINFKEGVETLERVEAKFAEGLQNIVLDVTKIEKDVET